MTAVRPSGPRETGAAEPLRILVVEDDRASRTMLAAFLSRSGYTVVQAAGGLEGITLSERERPDVVLMDIEMPDLDGYEAARAIKSASNGRFVPIIFLTATLDEEAFTRAIEAGGDAFLTKPYSPTALKAEIRAVTRVRNLYETVAAQRDSLLVHQRALDGERALASKIFAKIQSANRFEDPRVRARQSPLSIFNGDIVMVCPTPGGKLFGMLGDFTGHGLPAAIGTVPLRELFHALALSGASLDTFVTEINQKLSSILPTGVFCASTILEVDPERQALAVWNGGCPDLLIRRAAGHGVRRAPSRHVPLGVVGRKRLDLSTDTFRLAPGDRIYLYSDGLLEASNPGGELFGAARVEACLAEADPLVTLLAAVGAWRAAGEQSDDISLVEILFDGATFGAAAPAPGARATPTRWSFQLQLGADALREADPVPSLARALLDVQKGFYPYRDTFCTVLAELYSNALEHGVLELDAAMKKDSRGFRAYYAERSRRLGTLEQGWVRITLENEPHEPGARLRVIVEDSGKGFDTSRVAPASPNPYSGRGFGVLRGLCEEVHCSNDGRRVEAIIAWS